MESEDSVFTFGSMDEFLNSADELFDATRAAEHDDLLLRAVANVRWRVTVHDEFYNPASALCEEYDKCTYLSGDTWEKVLAPRSWLGKISLKRYNELMRGTKVLSSLWDMRLKRDSRVWAERLLGALAMQEDLLRAYALCEELTYEHREGPYSLRLRDEPADGEALEAVRLFERYAGYKPFHHNPFYVRPGELPQDREVDKTADRLSQEVWRYCASRSSAQLLGRLLLEDDYGVAHARELVQYGRGECCQKTSR